MGVFKEEAYVIENVAKKHNPFDFIAQRRKDRPANQAPLPNNLLLRLPRKTRNLSIFSCPLQALDQRKIQFFRARI